MLDKRETPYIENDKYVITFKKRSTEKIDGRCDTYKKLVQDFDQDIAGQPDDIKKFLAVKYVEKITIMPTLFYNDRTWCADFYIESEILHPITSPFLFHEIVKKMDVDKIVIEKFPVCHCAHIRTRDGYPSGGIDISKFDPEKYGMKENGKGYKIKYNNFDPNPIPFQSISRNEIISNYLKS